MIKSRVGKNTGSINDQITLILKFKDTMQKIELSQHSYYSALLTICRSEENFIWVDNSNFFKELSSKQYIINIFAAIR